MKNLDRILEKSPLGNLFLPSRIISHPTPTQYFTGIKLYVVDACPVWQKQHFYEIALYIICILDTFFPLKNILSMLGKKGKCLHFLF